MRSARTLSFWKGWHLTLFGYRLLLALRLCLRNYAATHRTGKPTTTHPWQRVCGHTRSWPDPGHEVGPHLITGMRMAKPQADTCDRLNRNPRSQTQPPNGNPPNKDPKQGVNHELGTPQMNHTPAVAAGVWFYLRSSPELPPTK
ncbi:hypothetical protein BS47DRAFT_1369119 [Hydnum rufescens UP504]|uniref:Uncharacterized protein n=1 Tax=Hydnum rufescens UP504 TaxID=1448309 RepID=A0A9P6AFI8_9AGAM|nr:hypothetical protein BS47DRAFT_1369119 [Hydnum rufescens UP504]